MHKLLNKQFLYTLFITTINAHATKVVMTEKKNRSHYRHLSVIMK